MYFVAILTKLVPGLRAYARHYFYCECSVAKQSVLETLRTKHYFDVACKSGAGRHCLTPFRQRKSNRHTACSVAKDFLAAGQGIEPRSAVPETAVLPLHHPAIDCSLAQQKDYT